MEGKSSVTRIIIDELHSGDVHRNQMEDEGGVPPSIIDEFQFSDI